jgi:hypothetical protein
LGDKRPRRIRAFEPREKNLRKVKIPKNLSTTFSVLCAFGSFTSLTFRPSTIVVRALSLPEPVDSIVSEDHAGLGAGVMFRFFGALSRRHKKAQGLEKAPGRQPPSLVSGTFSRLWAL